MEHELLELGVGVIAAVLILREVFNFVRSFKGNSGGSDHSMLLKDHIDEARHVATERLLESHQKSVDSLTEAVKALGEKICDQYGVQMKLIEHMERAEKRHQEKLRENDSSNESNEFNAPQ